MSVILNCNAIIIYMCREGGSILSMKTQDLATSVSTYMFLKYELLYNRVKLISTFFRFYHMGAFHDLNLLVLRPLKKKKSFSHTPH